MAKIIVPRLVFSEIEHDIDFDWFEVDNKAMYVFSHLIGYDNTDGSTKLLRMDGDGVLYVNTQGGAGENLAPSSSSMSTTATVIVASRATRDSMTLKNTGTETVYIGEDDTVTSANGFPIIAGESINFERYIGSIYGITATGSSDIEVLEVY